MRELMIGFSNISKMLCAGNVVLYQIKPKYCQNTKHIESQNNPDELNIFGSYVVFEVGTEQYELGITQSTARFTFLDKIM